MLAEYREWTVAATRFPRRRLGWTEGGSARLAAMLVLLALAACGDGNSGTTPPDPDPNRAPQWSVLLAELELTRGGSPATVDLADKVSDPDGDALSYAATATDSSRVAVSVAGSVVTVRPLATGITAVYVRARDPGGLEATSRFRVTVAGLADLVVRVSPDSVAVARGGTSEYAVEIANRGDGDMAATTTVHLFRSPDSVITTSDEMMGEPFDVQVLGLGASESRTASLTAAASAPLGDVFWVGACVDAVEAEEDASNNCSRGLKASVVPGVTYSFVVDGVESNTPSGHPQAHIRIAMDSDEAEWSGPGWLPLREDDPEVASKILEMLEITPVAGDKDYGADHDSDYDLAATVYDHYGTPGPINEDHVSITAANSQTVIAVQPPNYFEHIPTMTYRGLWQPGYYRLLFGNASSMEFAIDEVERYSCYIPSAGRPFEVVDHDIMQWRDRPGRLAGSMRSPGTDMARKRAHPDTTYVIEIAFVMSRHYWQPGWVEFIRDVAMSDVTAIYQRSGINVEFRATSLVAFADYKHYVTCQALNMDDNVVDDNSVSINYGQYDLMRALRASTGNDLSYLIQNYPTGGSRFCGLANARYKGETFEQARIGAAVGSVDVTCSSGDRPNLNNKYHLNIFIHVLAHEIGHNLGLYHNREYYTKPVKYVFHPTGFGYRSLANRSDGDPQTYGTIMGTRASRIPYMSMDTALTQSELCGDHDDRHDYRLNLGFCPQLYGAPGGSVLTDPVIRLGDSLNNASEAVQWTIRDASMYGEYMGSSASAKARLVEHWREAPWTFPLAARRSNSNRRRE